jgi:hypothetical protein
MWRRGGGCEGMELAGQSFGRTMGTGYRAINCNKR